MVLKVSSLPQHEYVLQHDPVISQPCTVLHLVFSDYRDFSLPVIYRTVFGIPSSPSLLCNAV